MAIDKFSETDIQKLHNENGQLRNQQFQIAIASLTFFGVANGWITTLQDHKNEYLITPILLLILCLLFLWSKRLKELIDEISMYLKIREVSCWEYDYREYSKVDKKRGQTKTLAAVYIILGLASTIIFFSDNHTCFDPAKFCSWVPMGSLLLYMSIIYVSGYRRHMVDECEVFNTWIKSINKVKLPEIASEDVKVIKKNIFEESEYPIECQRENEETRPKNVV